MGGISFEPINSLGVVPKFNVKPICIQHLQKIETITSCAKGYNLSTRSKALMEFDDYLDKIFTEQVDEETSYHYKITIAITQCMLVDMIDKNKYYPIHAMLYPSILRNFKSSNILFKPKYVQENFEIKQLQTFQIIDNSLDGIKIKLVRHGNLLDYEKNLVNKG